MYTVDPLEASSTREELERTAVRASHHGSQGLEDEWKRPTPSSQDPGRRNLRQKWAEWPPSVEQMFARREENKLPAGLASIYDGYGWQRGAGFGGGGGRGAAE